MAVAANGNGKAPVSRFIRNLETDRTRYAYTGYLKGFFFFLKNGTVRQPPSSNGPDLIADLDAQAVPYLAEIRSGERSAADDIEDFIAAAKRERYSPNSVNGLKSAAVGFFESNRIELSRLDEKRIRKIAPRNRAISEETIIKMDHLRAILPLMKVRDRALTLVLLSSGGRIGEVLKLRLKDVDLDVTPARVTFRSETTKTRERRISFITPEAVEAVRAWLVLREGYIKTAAARVKGLHEAGYAGPKRLDDNRLFPFEDTAYRRGLQTTLERAGLADRCEETGRFMIHPHGLRKFFRTRLAAAAGVDVAEKLMGHEGYLTNAYVRLTEEDLSRAYQEHSHVLTVARGAADELARQAEDQRLATEELQRQNEHLKNKLAAFEARTDRLESLTQFVENSDVYAAIMKAGIESLARAKQ